MPYIGQPPEDTFRGLAYYDTFTGDGSTTTFDVSADMPDGGQNDVTVVVDNVRQEPGATKSYTLGQDGSGNYRRVTFNVAPESGAEIYVINPGRTTQLVQVSDNAITTAKIVDGNVTRAKLEADAVDGTKLADDAVDSEHITDGSVDNVLLAGSIANDKLANSAITINGTSVSLGGSITAGTDWQAVVVADGSTVLNAVAGRGYFLDTNAGVIEVILPTNPTRGDTIIIADYGNNFATNRVILNTGGKLIDSTIGGDPGGDGFQINTNGAVVEIVFADDTAGWIIKQNNAPSDLETDQYTKFIEATGGTVTTTGNFKIHTFTGDGCFVVSCAGNAQGSNTVDYLVVAGGGGGAGNGLNFDAGGGGGAGGFRESDGGASGCYTTSPLAAACGALSLSIQTYPITVGAGGAGGPANNIAGAGSNSIFSTITSAGGALGARPSQSPGNGSDGGSGSGSVNNNTGGAGNTPPVSPPQGQPGGDGINSGSSGGGGGGGATAAGGNARVSPDLKGGQGGAGATTHITGSPVAYAGGGGAAGYTSGSNPAPNSGRPGGVGGGGSGGSNPSAPHTPFNGQAGTANTGGGGGASANSSSSTDGGAGGQGIVVIRYKFQ